MFENDIELTNEVLEFIKDQPESKIRKVSKLTYYDNKDLYIINLSDNSMKRVSNELDLPNYDTSTYKLVALERINAKMETDTYFYCNKDVAYTDLLENKEMLEFIKPKTNGYWSSKMYEFDLPEEFSKLGLNHAFRVVDEYDSGD